MAKKLQNWRPPMVYPTQKGINTSIAMEEPVADPEGAAIGAKPWNDVNPRMLSLYQMPGNPGDSAENKLTSSDEMKSGTNRTLFMDPAQHSELVAAMENSLPIRRLRSLLEKKNELGTDVINALPTGQTDLTPLAALTDAWTGSKLASSYKAPMSSQDLAKTILGSAENEYKGEQGISDDVLKGLQYMKAGSAMDQQVAKLGEVAGIGTRVPKPPSLGGAGGARTAINERYVIDQTNKVGTDFREGRDLLTRMKDAVAKNDLASLKQALSIAARAIGSEKGVLTEGDIHRIIPNTLGMKAAELVAFFDSDPSIKLDSKISQQLKNVIGEADKRHKATSRERYKNLRRQFEGSASYSGLNLNGLMGPVGQMVDREDPQGPSQADAIKKILSEALK